MSTQNNKSTGSSTAQIKVRVVVKVSKDFLHASVLLPKQSSGAEAVTEEEIRTALTAQKVTCGLLDDVIADTVARCVVDETIEVAHGDEPIPGDDAELEFLFDRDPDHAPKVGEEGRIDYHEVNFVQGVNEKQTLVRKTPPTDGLPGKGVNGESVPASRGKDVRLPKGTNTEEAADGLELVATVSGAVTLVGGKVAVRDVLTIPGDVDHSTGNIHSPGAVKIRGDVKSGFKVSAEGDIEISGSVEDAEVISESNILIKGGFGGRGEGLVKAAGSVTVQRVENQRIIAGKDILLGGDALSANLEAGERIIMNASKGSISGGEARAGKEIRIPTLGSEVWTETILRVANDVELKEEMKRIAEEVERLQQDQKRIKTAMVGLMKLELAKKLPEDKKPGLAKLREVSREIPENIKSLHEDEAAIQAKLAEAEKARIYATQTLYQGVKAYFGIVYLDVKAERGPTELSCYSGRVVTDDYKPSK